MGEKRRRDACSSDMKVMKQHMSSCEKRTFSTANNRVSKIMKLSMETESYGYGFATTLRPSSVDLGKKIDHFHQGYAHFLNYCHYCEKRITEKDNVYMYGSLQGFCSPQCRRAQITIDINNGDNIWHSDQYLLAGFGTHR